MDNSEAARRLGGGELGDVRIPNVTSILKFCHLLIKHQLTEKLVAELKAYLADQGVMLRSITLIDATILNASSSKKKEVNASYPRISLTKKANAQYFGMKARVGLDADSGILHSMDATTAKTRNSQV